MNKPEPIKVIKCFVHPDRDATNTANVPCAPGGVLYLCDECEKDPAQVFKAYKASHQPRIDAHKKGQP